MDLRFRPIEFKSSLSDVDCTNRCHCGCNVSQFYAFVSFLWLTTFFKSLQTRKCKIFVKRTKVLLLCLKNVVAINLRTSDEGHSSSLLWNRTRIWVKFANATLVLMTMWPQQQQRFILKKKRQRTTKKWQVSYMQMKWTIASLQVRDVTFFLWNHQSHLLPQAIHWNLKMFLFVSDNQCLSKTLKTRFQVLANRQQDMPPCV